MDLTQDTDAAVAQLWFGGWLVGGGKATPGVGSTGAFYFCINSNKHDNEMTTEMSDTANNMQFYFILNKG